MAFSAEFREQLRATLGRRRQQEVAERAGISAGYVSDMVRNGRVPNRGTLTRLADGLGLSDAERARLFAAAGYLDAAPSGGADTASREIEALAVQMQRKGLSPRQLEALRRLIDEPEQLDLIDQLARTLGRRVKGGLRAGLTPAAT